MRRFDHTVGSLVPPVVEASARLLHPATRHDEAAVVAAPGLEARVVPDRRGVTCDSDAVDPVPPPSR